MADTMADPSSRCPRCGGRRHEVRRSRDGKIEHVSRCPKCGRVEVHAVVDPREEKMRAQRAKLRERARLGDPDATRRLERLERMMAGA